MHPPSSCPLALPLFPHHFSSQASLVSSKFFPPHPSCSYLFDCVAIVSSCSLALLVLAYCVRRMPAPGKHNSKAGQLRADVITPVLMVYIFAFAFGLPWTALSEYLQRDLPCQYKGEVLCDYNL